MRKSIKNALDSKHFSMLSMLYNVKKWPLEESFEDFCSMLAHLDECEQDMIIELSSNFLCVEGGQYLSTFRKAFSALVSQLSHIDYDNIILTPLLPEKENSGTKSSIFLYYTLDSNFHKIKKIAGNIECSLIENYSNLINQCKETSLVCLFDDFVGSGKSAIDPIRFLCSEGIDKSQIVVLSLVAQQLGIENIRKEFNGEVRVISEEIRGRAISDNPDYCERYTSLMTALEERFNIPKKYHFGYKQTESLVKMERTPNNTFPVYWYSTSNLPTVPFPRNKCR